MLSSLKEFYRQMESNKDLEVATLLDPRYIQAESLLLFILARQMLNAAHERLEDLNEESLTTTMMHVRVERDDGSTTAAKRSDQNLMYIPFQRNVSQL